ncbi:hypothetical protein [Floccifex sp.]|uniref:hypothetical protein n=1 Tax=Floccifex sp. TaxID=2815810 RepID=UPI003F0A3272
MEIHLFYLLLDHGLPIEEMIELCFKNKNFIQNELNKGKTLAESFHFKNKKMNQYFHFFLDFLNMKEALSCTFTLLEQKQDIVKDCIKKLYYPLFIFFFCFGMIRFFNHSILPALTSFQSENQSLILFQILDLFYTSCFIGMLLFVILLKKMWIYIPFFKQWKTYEFAILFRSLFDTGLSSIECFQKIKKFSSFYQLEDYAMQGMKMETIFNQFKWMDPVFITFYQIGSQNAHLSNSIELYLNTTKEKIMQTIHKGTIYIQLLSYGSVGLVAILVYNIVLMPLEMLNGF